MTETSRVNSLGSSASCRAEVKTSRGPARSRRSNLGCRAKRTSIGSSATADVLLAIFGNVCGVGLEKKRNVG